MSALWNYTIILRRDDNGSFVAHVPAISGCHAYGHTPEEAQQELVHVFDMISDEYTEQGKPLPPDCQLKVAHAG